MCCAGGHAVRAGGSPTWPAKYSTGPWGQSRRAGPASCALEIRGRSLVRCCRAVAGAVDCRKFRRVSADRTLQVTVCGMPVVRPERAACGGNLGYCSARAISIWPAAPFGCSRRPSLTMPVFLETRLSRSRKGHLMPASPDLAVTIHYSGRRSVLRLQGELDACTRDQLRLAISSALKHPLYLLVVDLSAVGFMDCSGLSVLVWAHRQLAGQGGQLLITGAQAIVQRLTHLTRLDTELDLSPPEPVAQRPGLRKRGPFGRIRRHPD